MSEQEVVRNVYTSVDTDDSDFFLIDKDYVITENDPAVVPTSKPSGFDIGSVITEDSPQQQHGPPRYVKLYCGLSNAGKPVLLNIERIFMRNNHAHAVHAVDNFQPRIAHLKDFLANCAFLSKPPKGLLVILKGVDLDSARSSYVEEGDDNYYDRAEDHEDGEEATEDKDFLCYFGTDDDQKQQEQQQQQQQQQEGQNTKSNQDKTSITIEYHYHCLLKSVDISSFCINYYGEVGQGEFNMRNLFVFLAARTVEECHQFFFLQGQQETFYLSHNWKENITVKQSVSHCPNYDMLLLFEAIKGEHWRCVEGMIRAGHRSPQHKGSNYKPRFHLDTNYNPKCLDTTVLIALCRSKIVPRSCVESLFLSTPAEELNVDIVRRFASGTPLMFAVTNNRDDLVELLLIKKANTNIAMFGGKKTTPLHIALGIRRELVLRNYSSPGMHKEILANSMILQKLLDSRDDSELDLHCNTGRDKSTTLHLACEFPPFPELVRRCLDTREKLQRMDINGANDIGITPLGNVMVAATCLHKVVCREMNIAFTEAEITGMTEQKLGKKTRVDFFNDTMRVFELLLSQSSSNPCRSIDVNKKCKKMELLLREHIPWTSKWSYYCVKDISPLEFLLNWKENIGKLRIEGENYDGGDIYASIVREFEKVGIEIGDNGDDGDVVKEAETESHQRSKDALLNTFGTDQAEEAEEEAEEDEEESDESD